jgi:ribosome-binding factor A
MPGHRFERAAEHIGQVLSEVITHRLKDPRVGFLTVTRVKVAPDLTKATVFLSVLGDEAEQRTTLRALQHARGHIHRELASRVQARRHPEVSFKIDEGYQRSVRVARILSDIQTQAPPAAPADTANDEV